MSVTVAVESTHGVVEEAAAQAIGTWPPCPAPLPIPQQQLEQVMCWVGPPSAMVCLDLATDCLVNNYLLQGRQLAPDDSPSMFLMTRFRSLFWSWVVLPCQTGTA